MKQVNWALLGILLAGVMFWVTLGSCVYKACQSDSGPNVTCSCEPVSVEDEWEQCFRWAFGETYGTVTDDSDFPDLWNERHSDIFIIHGTDSIEETNEKIFKAWENSKPD